VSATLTVHEIIRTLEGESSAAGLPCVLVRLTGCNLRCTWCDTPDAWEQGAAMTIDEVLERVRQLGVGRVLITGGEPLAQDTCPALLTALCDAGHETSVETNGTMDLAGLDPRVRRVVDVKCPSSGSADAMCWANLDALRPTDEVKFVIADRADYDYARNVVAGRELAGRCGVLFSPVLDRLQPSQLAEWILADGLTVRLSLQLHRIIWPGRPRGV